MLNKLIAALVIVVCAFALPANAQETSGRAGTLTCIVDAGIGLVLGSRKGVNCTFKSGDVEQKFTGKLGKIGIDIGFTGGTVIVWAVFGPTRNDQEVLNIAGKFVGASAEITAAVGLGANLLVGATNSAIVLQPLSVQGQVGANISLTATRLVLNRVQ